MITTHKINDISFSGDIMRLVIDGKEKFVALKKCSEKLLNANEIQRSFFKISPSGYGIHWPLIDEDLSVEALLKVAEK